MHVPVGSGYTVEGQKTGEEKHGGLQIEIIPEYQRKAQKWLVAKEEEALKNYRLYLDESRTPADHSSPRRPGQAVTDIPRPSKKMPLTSTKKGGTGRGRRKKILPSSKFGKPQPKVLNVKAMGLAAGGKLGTLLLLFS